HAVGRALAARRNAASAPVVERGFAIGMLVVGAMVGLVSGALLLNDLLRRYVVTVAAAAAYDKPRPGGALGYAVLFIPLWIIFMRRVWCSLAQAETGAAGAGGEASDDPRRDDGAAEQA